MSDNWALHQLPGRRLPGPYGPCRKKCSAHDLDPAAIGTFDRVTCIGVLHYLADVEHALERMWSCVAPGGDLVLWRYATEGNRLMLPLIQSFRALGSRLPIGATHVLARGLALVGWPVIHSIPWRTEYYRRLGTLSFKNVESIIFDQMIPHIAHYWTRADMERLTASLAGGRTRIELRRR